MVAAVRLYSDDDRLQGPAQDFCRLSGSLEICVSVDLGCVHRPITQQDAGRFEPETLGNARARSDAAVEFRRRDVVTRRHVAGGGVI